MNPEFFKKVYIFKICLMQNCCLATGVDLNIATCEKGVGKD